MISTSNYELNVAINVFSKFFTRIKERVGSNTGVADVGEAR